MRAHTEDMISRGGVALAVSLDIVNAFKSLPWDKIVVALEHFEVPSYFDRLLNTA